MCPDCNEKLVDALPEEETKDEITEHDDWIELALLTSLPSVEMLLEVLREKNIPAVIQSDTGYFGTTGQMGPSSYQPAGGKYSLYVPEAFVIDTDREAGLLLGKEWDDAKLYDIEAEE
ncbi:MAG: hypothetical protein PHU88_11545 [candidate division Zixibacteria bacterium]|nr:hypothetical protein [candidate division Zixibacteria bacterium]MDD5425582.1 hypothetical protein [candidate division Zixibacteria bacterium]